MSTEPTIEQRLAALEAAVKEIQERLGTPSSVERWWEKIPPIPDDLQEAFEEMLEYGRAYRYADRPPEDAGTAEAGEKVDEAMDMARSGSRAAAFCFGKFGLVYPASFLCGECRDLMDLPLAEYDYTLTLPSNDWQEIKKQGMDAAFHNRKRSALAGITVSKGGRDAFQKAVQRMKDYMDANKEELLNAPQFSEGETETGNVFAYWTVQAKADQEGSVFLAKVVGLVSGQEPYCQRNDDGRPSYHAIKREKHGNGAL